MKAQVGDIELYYEVQGEGEPIVFIHGFMDDSSVWHSQIELFSAKHKVIAYDLRGHGMSDKPKGNYSTQTLADDLYTLMQILNLEKATIVGHSIGGMAAILFTLDHPDKVNKLVLVSTIAKASFMQRVQPLLKFILPYRTFVRQFLRMQYNKPSDEIIDHAFDIAMNTPKHVANEYWKELTVNYDIKRSLYRITAPTLIVAGEKDNLTPIAVIRKIEKEIEGSKLLIIPGCGHMVMIEKPNELNKMLQDFINEPE